MEQTSLISKSGKQPRLNQLFYHNPPSFLSYLALLVSSVLVGVLCELNRFPWNQNILLQNITSASFCVFSAALYVVYMLITTLLKLVLTYAGSFYHQVAEYEEEPETSNDESPREDHPNERAPKLKPWTFKSDAWSSRYQLPRSIIISSMYLGGSGAYLAILPLCMWDFTMSASFILSLLVISCVDAKHSCKDFKPNVDTASALRNLKCMRAFYHVMAFVSLILVIWIDTKEEIIYYMIPMLTTPSLDLHFLVPNQTDVSKPPALVLEGQTGLAFKWPLIILSASSPIFLRAGGGGIGRFFYSLPPSQTLETGLPVSTILAILILCWHSPTEHILREIQTMINYKTAIPMFVLCPLLIAAILAFVLYAFKRRSAGIVSVILLVVMCVRQQIATIRHPKTSLDWISISTSIHTVGFLAVYMLYKRRVLLSEQSTWTPKPVVIVQKEDDDANTDLELTQDLPSPDD